MILPAVGFGYMNPFPSACSAGSGLVIKAMVGGAGSTLGSVGIKGNIGGRAGYTSNTYISD